MSYAVMSSFVLDIMGWIEASLGVQAGCLILENCVHRLEGFASRRAFGMGLGFFQIT